ncbi:hypothetical protein ACFX15_028095 [Malus domestica]
MEAFCSSSSCSSSLLTKQPLPSCSSINFAAGIGSVSVLDSSMPSLKTRAFPNSIRKHSLIGIPRAFVAVEQQIQKSKVALIKIGTRGRYSFHVFPPFENGFPPI